MTNFDLLTKFEFKTTVIIYEKERDGLKPNTVREVDMNDQRYRSLLIHNEQGWNPGDLTIKITCAEYPKMSFERQIDDITFWKNLIIISWIHKKE